MGFYLRELTNNKKTLKLISMIHFRAYTFYKLVA
jgi:hypothetical protein